MSRAPYKYLDYYTFEDADLFFGREFEVQRMVGEILTSRLLVLFSPSGSGKTSLINAGVRPALEQLGHATAYVRFDKPPVPAVLDAVAKRLNAPLGENTEDLHAWFSNYFGRFEANQPKPTVVIFLDQFEEFFIIYRDQPEVREKFIAQLARLKYDADLPVYIVLSLREDYFVNLHEFREAVPSIFQNNANIRLRPFTENEARRAILEPAKVVDLHYEDGLADTLISDLQEQTPDKNGVEPIILQMVCHTLWQKRTPNNGAITRKLYDKCGGAQTIIANRLTQALDSIPKRDHSLMVKLFRALKTSDNLKRYRSLSDLQEALPNVEPVRLQKLLDQLTREEVLRHETRKSVAWYEFRHDYLVPQIAQWITRREERQQQKRMRIRYAIIPGLILTSFLFIWGFIRFNTFEVHFEPYMDGQLRELIITRGFNPFNYKLATGFFEADIRTNSGTRNALERRAFISMWGATDWDKLLTLLKKDRAGKLLYHTGRLDEARTILLATLNDIDEQVYEGAAASLVAFWKRDNQVIDSLVAMLKNQNNSARSRAASLLKSLGNGDAHVIEGLVTALKDENSLVRSNAASALGSLGNNDAHVIDALISMLKDQNSKTQLAAASALISLGKSESEVVALSSLLKHTDLDSRIRLLSSRKMQKEGLVSVISNVTNLSDLSDNVQLRAVSALGSLGKSDAVVISKLMTALRDQNSHDMRILAASSFVSLGKKDAAVISVLVTALKDQDPNVRFGAASALGSLGKRDAEVISALVSALKDPNSSVQARVTSALVSLGKSNAEGISSLLAALKDQDRNVRSRTVSALGSLGKSDARVIDALVAVLKDQDSEVRSHTVSALESLGKSDAQVIDALVAVLKDQDAEVRSRTVSALESLGKSDILVIDVLIVALKDQAANVRSDAASALGSLGKSDDRVIEALVAALKDQDSDVRSRAASSLGLLYKTESATSLLNLFAHKQSGYRSAAVEAIAALDTISAALEQAVKQKRDTAPEPWTRIAAWEAYERIQQRRQQDRTDSLSRTQVDSIFSEADSLFKAQDYTTAEETYSQAYNNLRLNRVSRSDSLKVAVFQFAQARCQSLQKRLLPALESLETAFKYDLALKEKLASELERHADWAHIRQNWYLREVLLGQAKRAEGEE